MKKYIILTIISLCLGYLMAKIIFIEYKSDKVIALNINADKYYFIQLGTYSSYDSMKDNTFKLNSYIYTEEDNIFYVFTCITKDYNNISKLEEYYKNMGYDTSIKEYILNDQELSNTVSKVDMILNSTNDGIKELCKESISKYKEG